MPRPLPLLTVDDVSIRLNVPTNTVRTFVRDGLLPTVKLGGKAKSRLRFRPEDVEEFVDAGYTPATSGPLVRDRP